MKCRCQHPAAHPRLLELLAGRGGRQCLRGRRDCSYRSRYISRLTEMTFVRGAVALKSRPGRSPPASAPGAHDSPVSTAVSWPPQKRPLVARPGREAQRPRRLDLCVTAAGRRWAKVLAWAGNDARRARADCDLAPGDGSERAPAGGAARLLAAASAARRLRARRTVAAVDARKSAGSLPSPAAVRQPAAGSAAPPSAACRPRRRCSTGWRGARSAWRCRRCSTAAS